MRGYNQGAPDAPRAHRFVGRTTDGNPVVIWHMDLGTTIDGIDSEGRRYPTYTSVFKTSDFIQLVQCDQKLCLDSGDPARFRLAEDHAFLESCGVDLDSLSYEAA